MSSRLIAFVPCPPPYAGPEVVTQTLLGSLDAADRERLTVVRSNVRTNNESKGRFDAQGIWSSLQTLGRLCGACLWRRPTTLYFLLSSSRVGYLRDSVVILIGKLFFAHVIAHYHGSRFGEFYRHAPWWYRPWIRWSLRWMDQLVVEAESLKSGFSGLYPRSRMAVLPNPIPDEMLAESTAMAVRKRHPHDAMTILFLGHICFTKGFYDLMLAYKNLYAKNPRLRLLVVGDLMLDSRTQKTFLSGDTLQRYLATYPQIHQAIEEFVHAGHQYGVEFHDIIARSDKAAFYQQADMFVLPSYTEGFPMAMLEAMTFGLPLIVSTVGAMPEVLQQQRHALFVEPGNGVQLAQALEQLVDNASLRASMGDYNRRLVQDQFVASKVQKPFRAIVFRDPPTRPVQCPV